MPPRAGAAARPARRDSSPHVKGRPAAARESAAANRHRPDAERAYEHARQIYRRILAESKD